MFVVKRDGRKEQVHFDKITSRIQKLCYGLDMDHIDPPAITLQVINSLYSGVTTVELDNLAAEIAATMEPEHPDYATLAARIGISNLQKETKKIFTDVMEDLYNAIDDKTQQPMPLISEKHYNIFMKHADRLNSSIIYDRDFSYNYFAFKTLEKLYLLRIRGKVVERPQHMLMRVAVGIHEDDVDAVIETYNLLSEQYFIHASPTLFTAATPSQRMSSCFVLAMRDDSILGIYQTLKQCALMSTTAGGIGLHVHCIRASGSYIAGTNGVSNGLVPMLRVYDSMAVYSQMSSNKRPCQFAVYLEPWHADVLEFLELKKAAGAEETRARDLLYGLWIPDLFMKRVKASQDWSLMCPHECPGLVDSWGEDFEQLYERYEAEGRYKKQVKAQELWRAIVVAQLETGCPLIMYKDSCNRKSNQQNLGTLKCGNMCGEIVQYTSPDEVAVCNMASIAVKMFVTSTHTFDFEKLRAVTKVVTRNLDKVIDVTTYPVPEARTSNVRHRPVGIGIQGLADAFILMRLPFDSKEARQLNIQIFETIYYGALEASCELAEKLGPYETYWGSPISRGVLQYDMWDVTPSSMWDWGALKARIAQHGVRNSLLVAPMPTASTANILGNYESFEPLQSNVCTRRISDKEFKVVNHYLLRDLIERKLWDENIRSAIIANEGSLQGITDIPDDLQSLYRPIWEISQKTLMQMAADRAPFIDQSQSFNIYAQDISFAKLTSMHFYTWSLGLKTGMYQLRVKPSALKPQNIPARSVAAGDIRQEEQVATKMAACSLQARAAGEDCQMCGS